MQKYTVTLKDILFDPYRRYGVLKVDSPFSLKIGNSLYTGLRNGKGMWSRFDDNRMINNEETNVHLIIGYTSPIRSH